jgi:very-short-patch-repair endonuclease
MYRAAERALAELAALQFGLFTRSQVLTTGLSDDAFQWRVDRATWDRWAADVYALPGYPTTFGRLAMAACLEMGPESLASHECAGRLLGLSNLLDPAPVVVAVLHARHHRSRLAMVRQLTDLRPVDRTVVDGIPVTTPERTLVDLAAVLRPGRFTQVLGDALAAGITTYEAVRSCHEALARRGKPGTRLLRRALEAHGPGLERAESTLERRLLMLLRDAGVVGGVVQHALPWRAALPGRVDLAFPVAKLIVEADSRRWHGRFDDFDRDRARDNAAQLAGWRVLRFTWRQLVDEADSVATAVRTALALAPRA